MIYNHRGFKIFTGADVPGIDKASKLKKRFVYNEIYDKFRVITQEKVFILYGLRRTGKSTLMKQLAYDLLQKDSDCIMYVTCEQHCALFDVETAIYKLYESSKSIRYCFIDEASRIDSIIDGGSAFSDFLAGYMNIMLAGTDSLAFRLAIKDSLFDRAYMYDTTFISYAEQSYLLGITDVDDYIRYGGLLSESGKDYNSGFEEYIRNEYANTAIAHNIVRALWLDRNGYSIPTVFQNYSNCDDIIAGCIVKIFNDRLHRATIKQLSKKLKFHDFGIIERKFNAAIAGIVSDKTELENIREYAMGVLGVSDTDAKLITQSVVSWLDSNLEYLKLFTKVDSIDVNTCTMEATRIPLNIILQPGIRYGIIEALIEAMHTLCANAQRSDVEAVSNILEQNAFGFILEDVVLSNTKIALNNKNKKVMSFTADAIGEYDMIVFDMANNVSHLYEIKHSKDIAFSEQTKYLRSAKMLSIAEQYVAPVASRTVLYRGETRMIEGIQYKNVEEYLLELVKDSSTSVFEGMRRAKFI